MVGVGVIRCISVYADVLWNEEIREGCYIREEGREGNKGGEGVSIKEIVGY
ncbi:hypothetical protein CWI37_1324p0020 [Hamiltosporidium tvaerminnensis]|uniref:Uncharacterized protein n=1 Tax=Hamiltosporidium tvaerminnensis TaxID=1176355 RepID=A0A4Q9KX32_9MICR|nr:hypothetical protein CWI37_1324p0020 [Hamiltosporidium tvaerminnensis]